MSERPLITFVLFTYNHEAFVREAVRAAFAQTYEPLEIILSDDGSGDNTFAILQEEVEQYSGPHKLILRQTPCTLKPLGHVADVARIASGELLVLAAGDDISHPQRTAIIAETWKKTRAWAIYSAYTVIDERGDPLPQPHPPDIAPKDALLDPLFYAKEGPVQNIQGLSSCYTREAFSLLPPKVPEILSEDATMTVLLNAYQKPIMHISEPLVQYRQHAQALTHYTTEKTSISDRITALRKKRFYAFAHYARSRFLLEYFKQNKTPRRVNQQRLRGDIYYFGALSQPLACRLLYLLPGLWVGICRRNAYDLLPALIGTRAAALLSHLKHRLWPGRG